MVLILIRMETVVHLTGMRRHCRTAPRSAALQEHKWWARMVNVAQEPRIGAGMVIVAVAVS
jgi:hypothetical protein